jgi:hypothetical protein
MDSVSSYPSDPVFCLTLARFAGPYRCEQCCVLRQMGGSLVIFVDIEVGPNID